MRLGMRLATIVALTVAFASPAWAQREQEIVVYAFPLDQVTTTTESANLPNVGQTQHSMYVRLEGGACTDAGLSVFFEQGNSFADDPGTIVWSQLGDPVTDVEYGAIGTSFRSNTSGAVQFIRVNPDGFDTVNCELSVTYVGSVRPVPLFDIGGDSLTIIAQFYNFITVTVDPACLADEYFLFYNVTDMVLRICENTVITAVGSSAGANEILLSISDAVLLDGTTDNGTVAMSRERGVLAGTDPFYLVTLSSTLQHLQWTFFVPTNFDDGTAPVMRMWMFPSTSIGTFAYDVEVRCVTPDESENWGTMPFDTVNTLSGVTFTGANHLTTLDVTLTNRDSMAAGDLCQVDFQQVGAALESAYLRALISYTGT